MFDHVVKVIIAAISERAAKREEDTAWRNYATMQAALTDLQDAIVSVNTDLGVLVGSGIAALVYFRDHAGSGHGGVISWLLVLAVLFALDALVRVRALRRPDVVVVALRGRGAVAVQEALKIMQCVYVHNENIRRIKEKAKLISVVAFVGLLTLDAVWPWLVRAALALGHLAGRVL